MTKLTKIEYDTALADIAEHFPKVAEHLTEKYGFHCLNCFLSEFETFEEGAAVHGIVDEELDELLEEVNNLIEESNNM